MGDLIKTAMAALLLKTYLLLMDFNELRAEFSDWRERKKEFHCRECGCVIDRGTGVIIKGTGYYYCQECIRKKI